METSVTRLLGIEQPIIQAPIGGLSVPALAGAVSNAGGLGMMAMSWKTPDQIREQIAAVRAITDRPFGINLIIDDPDDPQDERLAVALDAGVRIVSFFWGDPAPFMPAVRAAGAKATLTVGSAEEARRAVDHGVDVIVAQGWEAGGHVRGQVSTLALVPAVDRRAAGHAGDRGGRHHGRARPRRGARARRRRRVDGHAVCCQ